jgi:hypothetical protein
MLCDLKVEVNHFRKGLLGWLNHTNILSDIPVIYSAGGCKEIKSAVLIAFPRRLFRND